MAKVNIKDEMNKRFVNFPEGPMKELMRKNKEKMIEIVENIDKATRGIGEIDHWQLQAALCTQFRDIFNASIVDILCGEMEKIKKGEGTPEAENKEESPRYIG